MVGFYSLLSAEKVQFPLHSCDLMIDGDCFAVSSEADTYYGARSHCQVCAAGRATFKNKNVQTFVLHMNEPLLSSGTRGGLSPYP